MNDIYAISIFPIELIYKYIYLALATLVDNYGVALIALSLLNYFILIPLNKLVRGLQLSENNIQEILAPQLKAIKESSLGEQRHQRIQNLYKRYSYHPIFALRNVLPLLMQLPFLMAVYFMLSSLENIQGIGFLFLQNLATPDALLFGYNILPFVMTLISLLNACFIVKLSPSQKKQAIVVALVFLALLYNAPSGLLVYWTMNNVIILAFAFLSKLSSIKKIANCFSTTKQKLLPSLLDSSGLLLSLAFILPLFFTLSLNVNAFSDEQLSNFFIFIFAVSGIFIILGIILDKIIKFSSLFTCHFSWPFSISIKKTVENTPSTFQIKLSNIIYILIACLVVFFILLLCINIRLYISNRIIINILRLILVLSLFLFIRKFKFKAINIGMISIMIFCCIQFANSHAMNMAKSKNVDLLVKKSFAAFPVEEKLQTRPNIYLVVLESYMSSKTLRDTFKHDNSTFENKLKEKGFQVHDNLYAHASSTSGSLISIFTMQEDIAKLFIGNQDIITDAFDLISGGEENLLFNFLNKNNYTISCFYFGQQYLFKHKGKLVDQVLENIDVSYKATLSAVAPNLHTLINAVETRLFKIPRENKSYDIYERTFQYIENTKNKSQPSFLVVKPHNSIHADPNNPDIPSTFPLWIKSGKYQQGVDEMNLRLLELIDKIEKDDPNAVIVLLGDHGYRFCWASRSLGGLKRLPAEFMRDFPEVGMTTQDYINDSFSTFFAIKMPKEAKGQFILDEEYTYSNLFRYIFAALDDNPIFLQNKTPNVSINFNGVVVKRGEKIYANGEK